MDPVDVAVVAGKVFLATNPGALARIKSFLKGRHRVVVLGSTGVGKTQLVESLTQLLPPTISYLDRTAFATHDEVQIGKDFFTVWDTPGQDAFNADRANVVRTAGRRKFGVINVVANGYHEYRANISSVFDNDGRPMDGFLTRHRELEVEQLSKLAPLLSGNLQLSWFLTLVTKADMWWDERDSVFDNYEHGPYSDIVKQIAPLGAPVVLDYCSVMQPFYGTYPGRGSYGDDDRRRARETLLATLITAIGKRG